MGEWDGWIGRECRQDDELQPALARRWLATFNLETPDDGIMPQGIHLCLCTPEARQDALGQDGHPLRDNGADSFYPPIPLPRRMWAASEMEFIRPIAIGAPISRISKIISIAEKEGSSGKLGFVNIGHETQANGELAIREVQTLVYRQAVPSDAPLSPPDAGSGSFDGSKWNRIIAITPDPCLLFRYSALTFNTHRIHYDLPYARDVERYRGLVVHGPLMASLLLQMAARELGENQLGQFSFRAVSPAIAGEILHLAMRQDQDHFEFGAFAPDGRQCVKATGKKRI